MRTGDAFLVASFDSLLALCVFSGVVEPAAVITHWLVSVGMASHI
jgi:hypothetical protein